MRTLPSPTTIARTGLALSMLALLLYSAAAAAAGERFRRAWASADVRLAASRF